ncbi:MAG: LysM peptidoglycan-binding domain-containing protein, partial [Caldilineaceae bacterium]|nr:LysM peptidoglycan-binding domain-containing protein [Caldilineaceae bacterium]
ITTVVSLSGRGWSPILPWSSTANRGTDEIDTPAIVAPAQPTDVAPQDAPLLMPTVTPGVDIPNDVVQILEPEPVAQGTLSAFVVNPLQPFDLDTYLQENGRLDLAGLGVVASSKEGVLLLDGIVPAYQVRQDLIDLMESAPGVNRVSGANLLVRWPPTYTVAEGDTLWAISYYLYGEDHVAELLAANRAVLPASNMLTIGMELNIPEIEQ